MFYLSTTVYYFCAWWLQRSKEGMFLLGLELKMVVSCPVVGAGNLIWVLWENNPCSEALSHLFGPDLIFFLMDSGEKGRIGVLIDARAFQVELEVC